MAEFLSQQNNLRLVFLNGCSTANQVDALLVAGVGLLWLAYGLAFLDESNLLIKVFAVAGGLVGILAGIAQIVGKSLRNPWE